MRHSCCPKCGSGGAVFLTKADWHVPRECVCGSGLGLRLGHRPYGLSTEGGASRPLVRETTLSLLLEAFGRRAASAASCLSHSGS